MIIFDLFEEEEKPLLSSINSSIIQMFEVYTLKIGPVVPKLTSLKFSLLTNTACNVQLHQCIVRHTVSGGGCCVFFFVYYTIQITYHRLCIVCTKGGSVLCRWGFTAYRNILSLHRHCPILPWMMQNEIQGSASNILIS